MASATEASLRERLATLNPQTIEIIDDSAEHAGHAGAKHGGHYRLLIISTAFNGKATLARHRIVFDALGDLMHSKIHALSIQAFTPDER